MAIVVLISACMGPLPRQDSAPEITSGPLILTTIGVNQFLASELLRGIAETRLLGSVVPRERRAEPTPDEAVLMERASLIIAYGGEIDRNSVEMIRRSSPDSPLVLIHETPPPTGFAWLDPKVLRDDARKLHDALATRFDSGGERARLDSNLSALDVRLAALEENLETYRDLMQGQRIFADDPRMHPFLHLLGIEIIDTVVLGVNGQVEDDQRERITALANESVTRILLITHPEKKELLGQLAREADLTLVYFNPFFDGVTGVGKIDTVIPRQLQMLTIVLNTSLAAPSVE